MVGYHHRLPMSSAFGTGTLASSDGQRFPVKGKSIIARHLSRYFARGQGISAYTAVSDAVSDQHATLDTKVIAADAPEGHIVLDGILGNTDPPILERAAGAAPHRVGARRGAARPDHRDHPPRAPSSTCASSPTRPYSAPALPIPAGHPPGQAASTVPFSPCPAHPR
jgi:hypothetical protein